MLAPKTDFIGFDDSLVHLASGGQPPLLKRHRQALERFALDKARGTAGYDAHWAVRERVRNQLARLTGLPAEAHAIVGNASEGIARAVWSFPWGNGDNVVVADKDYASGRYSLLRLAAFGVEPRVVPSDGWYIDPNRLLDSCDERTRLVYLSQVTSLTGQRFDIAAISAALERKGIALLVDASHALGVIPVDATLADFTVSSCYKYLCATHLGVLAWNRDRQPGFEPGGVGWCSADDSADGRSYVLKEDASRAELGNPNHLDVYLLEDSLSYLLDFGIDAIAAHACTLSSRLFTGLSSLGLPLVTPSSASERATSVAFADEQDRNVVMAAAEAGILLWDGNGRVRASTHLFNTEADVDCYVDWLRTQAHSTAAD